jgi:hypothetical protein
LGAGVYLLVPEVLVTKSDQTREQVREKVRDKVRDKVREQILCETSVKNNVILVMISKHVFSTH